MTEVVQSQERFFSTVTGRATIVGLWVLGILLYGGSFTLIAINWTWFIPALILIYILGPIALALVAFGVSVLCVCTYNYITKGKWYC